MKILFTLTVYLLISLNAWAGEMVITGNYQGKNIYIQNPYSASSKSYCINEIFLNNQLVASNIVISAYTLNLSHLRINEPVTIKIIHKDDCQPRIVNLHVIKSKYEFTFVSMYADESTIYWSTIGEKTNGKFYIEQQINNQWVIVKTINGKGKLETNQYSFLWDHYSGVNKYRINYFQDKDNSYYSKEFEFSSKDEPVTFTPQRVTDKITLSREIAYEIFDKNKNKVKYGSGKIINVRDLKPGLYYLGIENRTEKFYKR